jgi:hypothetical protein
LCLWVINPVLGCVHALGSEGLAIDLTLICLFMAIHQSIFLGLWIPGLVGAYTVHRILRGRARLAE